MLNVKTSEQARDIICSSFKDSIPGFEAVEIEDCLGRILYEDIRCGEPVPGFDRSTVDGYAVAASSTFGCSDSMPAILKQTAEVIMGQETPAQIDADSCAYVPTGGHIPFGANAMVMIEHTEDYGDGTLGILRPCAPGSNIIFKGDDVKKGTVVFRRGTRLSCAEIGVLAALGQARVKVFKRPRVAVISTGDELADVRSKLLAGQIRDVNGYVLCSSLEAIGCEPVHSGIIKDDAGDLLGSVRLACESSDLVLISGGSSVGVKDAVFQTIDALGEVFFHGISIKPGKPTICGKVGSVPVFGLPGHPLAAYFIFDIFVRPLLFSLMGACDARRPSIAVLDTAIPSNHGREECVPVKIYGDEGDLCCSPVFIKSGLISALSSTHGYIRIPRDCEGLSKGEPVKITLY
ncbi:MAG: molybdopterin molybdotransferase MoeA [Oscillospiraceae bacterium]|jgi:molybdenum cofactor synthesis domain-containing protein|nr:molybdopterin molybdotransferase MoeA [Oscillospiraceae bacterium]